LANFIDSDCFEVTHAVKLVIIKTNNIILFEFFIFAMNANGSMQDLAGISLQTVSYRYEFYFVNNVS